MYYLLKVINFAQRGSGRETNQFTPVRNFARLPEPMKEQ